MSQHKKLAITLARTLACLLLIPLITLWFISHEFQDIQQYWDANLEKQLNATHDTFTARGREKVPQLSAEEQQYLREFRALLRKIGAAGLCRNPHPEVAEMRAQYCKPPFGDLWQLTWMRAAAWIALVAGVLLLAYLAGLWALAHARRHLRYTSFLLGWHVLTTASVIIAVLQGSMGVWLLYWGDDSGSTMLELIGFAGAVLAGVAFATIRQIFRRPAPGSAIAGELVSQANAPHLWQRIGEIAQRLKTRAPDHVIAGIDTDFFATEAPLLVDGGASGERIVQGRKLYVSIPLLRLLERQQADAVLVHELAFLSGVDARREAKWEQFARYMEHLHENVWLFLPFFALYRMIFESALAKDSRARAFRADRTAAKLVSPQAITHALIKIEAYARYCDAGLFDHGQHLDEKTGTGEWVVNGLLAWANTPAFAQTLTEERDIPHSYYDSYPPLVERMRNIGHVERPEQFAAIITRPVAHTWANGIRNVWQIEAQLWGSYEEDFAADHEQTLATRYEPANEAERMVVLKYFPDQYFALKNGRSITVTYQGIIGSTGKMLAHWQEVKTWWRINPIFMFFSPRLALTLHEKRSKLFHKVLNLRLAGLKCDELERFFCTVNRYFLRHKEMRIWQA